MGGLFIVAERLMQVGDEVMLTLVFPGRSEPVPVRADVRWVRLNLSKMTASHPV
jgi:Tfp pilus assembly protein PilZ